MNIYDWFNKWAVYSPDKIAVKEYESQRTLTYSELNNLSNFLAAHFRNELKLTKGDHVAVLAENCLEYIVLFGVAQKLGITLVPLNYRLTTKELDYVLSNSDAKLIITEEKFHNKICELDAYKNCVNKLAFIQLQELLKGKSNIKTQFRNEELNDDLPIFIIYTSGTTAFPKGALYTHKMLFWNSINTEIRLAITSEDKSLSATPPFHTGSWNVLFATFVLHGAYTVIMKNFDADAALKILEEEDCTLWWAVPTMLNMMSDSDLFDKVKLKNLRYFVVGGEAMPIPLIDKWHNKGVLIRQGYGLTEVGPNVTSLDHTDAKRKQGSIGTPNFFYQTKLVDEKGSEVIGEGVGELALKGPTVTTGYWKNDQASKDTIRDGWFYTGDVVKRDAEGYLFVVDRIKNMYISGGENVYPAEVEYTLRQHPEIEAVAIIGVPDDKWGESGKAFIVRKKDSNITSEEIAKYCVERLAKYKVPKHIEFLNALPTNDAGKIDRKKLKKESE